MRGLRAAIVAGVLLATGAAGTALGQAAPPADALSDPAFKGPEVVAFMDLKPGAKVADIVAGRFVRTLSQAVGPTGKVYAVMPAEVVKAHPEVVPMLTASPPCRPTRTSW
jgi:predicted methyltransferase